MQLDELKKTGAEFGYRSASEILRLIDQLTVLDNSLSTNQKIDISVMQKLLPRCTVDEESCVRFWKHLVHSVLKVVLI